MTLWGPSHLTPPMVCWPRCISAELYMPDQQIQYNNIMYTAQLAWPDLPIFVIWLVCLGGTLFWLWNLFRLLRRMQMWSCHLHSGRGMMFCRHCCCQWSTVWTCSQSSGLQHPSAIYCHLLMPSETIQGWHRNASFPGIVRWYTT